MACFRTAIGDLFVALAISKPDCVGILNWSAAFTSARSRQRNWALSKCTYLIPGNMFHFELKNGKVEIFAHKGGSKKEETLTFDIMSRQPR